MEAAPAPSGYGTAATAIVALCALVAAPHLVDPYTILQLTSYVVLAILALSLGLVWGIGGIMCFGQTVFFGLGAYTYAVAAENMSDSTIAIVLAIALPAAVSAALGYFMFFGRLGSVYVGVVTLCLSLILLNFANSTQDRFYTIGHAALNGFNGMAGVPTINVPFAPDRVLDPVGVFYLCGGSLVALYLGCELLAASSFGRVAAAVRGNELRAGLIGYNAAAVKLAIFAVGAAIAGYAGCLYTNWNGFVSPHVFGLTMMAQVIIWTIVGGLGTLIGPIVGAFALQYLSSTLGSLGVINPYLLLGLLLMVFVAFVPEGVVPMVRRALTHLPRRRAVDGVPRDGSVDPMRTTHASPSSPGLTLGLTRRFTFAPEEMDPRVKPAGDRSSESAARPILETRGLEAWFGGVAAVRNVSLVVGEGEVRCLIGPNGAGKSTFLKMVTGQIRPSRGAIRYRDIEITGRHLHAIARLGIGTKTQVPQLFDDLTVSENVRLAARRHGSGRRLDEEVARILEEVDMLERRHAIVGRLAHGHRQWTEIGVVLAGRPQLVLLDEPAAGMSSAEVDRTAELIRRIHRTRTVVVVDHDMRFVRQIATRVTVLHRGEIFMEGEADAVLSSAPVHEIYLGAQAQAAHA